MDDPSPMDDGELGCYVTKLGKLLGQARHCGACLASVRLPPRFFFPSIVTSSYYSPTIIKTDALWRVREVKFKIMIHDAIGNHCRSLPQSKRILWDTRIVGIYNMPGSCAIVFPTAAIQCRFQLAPLVSVDMDVQASKMQLKRDGFKLTPHSRSPSLPPSRELGYRPARSYPSHAASVARHVASSLHRLLAP